MKDGGSVANVGHLYAFGNTEEWYRIKILGVKARGREGHDQTIPPGVVGCVTRAYYDALRNKKATVIPYDRRDVWRRSPQSRAYVRRLAARAKGARAHDRTSYGRSRTSTKSFYLHHVQQLAAAAQVGDARAIRRKISHMKMRLMKAAKAGGRA